jgi:hypothetical protein
MPKRTKLPCMTGKVAPTGWVVQVTIPAQSTQSTTGRPRAGTLPDAPSFKYFNVAIAASEKAVEATKKHLADDPDRETRAVRALSSEEIAVLRLKAGEVKPA